MPGRLRGLKSSLVRHRLDSHVHQVAAMPLNLPLLALSLLPLTVQSGFPLAHLHALPPALPPGHLPDLHLLNLFLSLSLPHMVSLLVIVSANGRLGRAWQSQMPIGRMR